MLLEHIDRVGVDCDPSPYHWRRMLIRATAHLPPSNNLAARVDDASQLYSVLELDLVMNADEIAGDQTKKQLRAAINRLFLAAI